MTSWDDNSKEIHNDNQRWCPWQSPQWQTTTMNDKSQQQMETTKDLIAEPSGDDDPDEVDNDKLKNVQHCSLDITDSLKISFFYKAKSAKKNFSILLNFTVFQPGSANNCFRYFLEPLRLVPGTPQQSRPGSW